MRQLPSTLSQSHVSVSTRQDIAIILLLLLWIGTKLTSQLRSVQWQAWNHCIDWNQSHQPIWSCQRHGTGSQHLYDHTLAVSWPLSWTPFIVSGHFQTFSQHSSIL